MKEKLSIQKRFACLTRFVLICGFVIAVTCAGPAGVAQENYGHHHRNEIYKIDVNASASRPLLHLLSHDYSIVDMDKVTPPFKLFPVLIGPDALENQDVTAYLVRAYRAGLTVAIAYATQKQANRFEQLVEGETAASCLPTPGSPRMAFYAVQRTTREQPEEVSRYCLPALVNPGKQANDAEEQWLGGRNRKRSGETEEQWLSAAFALQSPLPPQQSVDVADGTPVNLDSLSRQTHCSELLSNANGQVQDDLFVTSLRNFDSQRDYYYVKNFPQIMSYRPASVMYAVTGQPLIRQAGQRDRALNGTRLLFSEPATTTQYVSGYTNERSTTVSASVGFQGFTPNISVSRSVTVGTSTSVTVPPITIVNSSSLASGTAQWYFQPSSPRANVLYSPATSWVWYIDRGVYGDTPNEIREVSTYFQAGIEGLMLQGVCGFPPPFPTFEVGAPEITSVDPGAVQRGGGTFLIRGARMYPGILRNVLLGGDALPPANFVPINDTEIRVVVPSSQNRGQNAVQVNTSFNGSVLPSNTDVRVNVK